IKKRTRPQARVREISIEREEEEVPQPDEKDESTVPLADLLELRKLRKARAEQGRYQEEEKRAREEGEEGGLKKGVPEDEEDAEEKEARTRRVIRSNNFTQQTNALDVDKHMMAYIEENLKVRSKPKEESDDEDGPPIDPQEALYNIADRWNVTNSLTMLTAIPEVDLGMEYRKGKRVVAEGRQERKKNNNDEEHLLPHAVIYRPNLRAKSDADVLRDAKLEAMGMPPQDDSPRRSNHERTQMATDEMVMERFKKRMRK
ncbi:hepatocellular carcinoma-associated antigen 59-domain-containing protein, partial [Pholiota molesta]